MRRTIGKRLLESTQQLPHFYATAEINMGEWYGYDISKRYLVLVAIFGYLEEISYCRYEILRYPILDQTVRKEADSLDRLIKLREIFNKASEGKTKLSVNDFSTYLSLHSCSNLA
jgi:hypothetical protein